METEITKLNFESEVLKSDKPVLVDFWAIWCGPCRMIAPFIKEIAEEYDEIKVCKLNVDVSPEIAVKYGIESIPTLILFKNGKAEKKLVGYMTKEEIVRRLDI